MIVNLVGALGGLLFVFACLPMAYATVKKGAAAVTDRTTIWTFVCATILFGAYLIAKTGFWNVPSMSIGVETICWSIVAWYSYFPRPTYLDVFNFTPMFVECPHGYRDWDDCPECCH